MTLMGTSRDAIPTPEHRRRPPKASPKMNAMTAIAAPIRAYRRDRRIQVQVPRVERRLSRDEQRAAAALQAQLRDVREHSYLATPVARFRVF